jgi:hypothetical protein
VRSCLRSENHPVGGHSLKVKEVVTALIVLFIAALFFFNACILRYYLSKPLTSLSCFLNAVFPGLQMWDTFACATANCLTHFIISIAVLENVPPDAGLQKRATFSTLNVGLAGPRNRTRATCVASSGTNRSAILYAFYCSLW